MCFTVNSAFVVVYTVAPIRTKTWFLLCPWERSQSMVMRMSVCTQGYLRKHTHDLYRFHNCARCLWPWLSPPLASLRYVMFFRFCGWHHVFPIMGHIAVWISLQRAISLLKHILLTILKLLGNWKEERRNFTVNGNNYWNAHQRSYCYYGNGERSRGNKYTLMHGRRKAKLI